VFDYGKLLKSEVLQETEVRGQVARYCNCKYCEEKSRSGLSVCGSYCLRQSSHPKNFAETKSLPKFPSFALNHCEGVGSWITTTKGQKEESA
jgi:hypothetical protein